MADIQMGGRGFAPQAGSVHAYQAYQPQSAEAAQGVGGAAKTGTALAGAALSLALLIGVSVWGYKLMARDVAGVPVVRAVQGDMRIRPQDPGGSQADNQGFAVNQVAAAGATAGPSDQIVLAPEPIDLGDDSAPLIDQLAAALPDARANDAAAPETVQPAAAEVSAEMSSIQALADQIAAGATPLSGIGQVETPPVRTTVAAPAQPEVGRSTPAVPQRPQAGVVDAAVSGVARSPRPSVRPADLRTASLGASVAAPSAGTGVRDIDPASIPAGTRLVQLGAYESPDIARTEWTRFAARFGEYLEGKDRVVQRAQSGGRIFYRLRVMNFSDLSDARRFCAALTAQNTDCIPVVTR